MGADGINRLDVHKPDYKSNSWEEYSFEELGYTVAFFSKRAGHRTNQEKLRKDLYDGKNYLTMMIEKYKRVVEGLGLDFEDL